MQFLKSLHLDGFLSFAPGSEAIPLTSLNVLIGPNGSGKSNLIEALELLRATPTAFAAAIRAGGGVTDYLWKGDRPSQEAVLETQLAPAPTISGGRGIPVRYKLAFAASAHRTEIVDEVIEEAEPRGAGMDDVYFYYRFQRGNPVINARSATEPDAAMASRRLVRASLLADESVLSQRKDPDLYPELTWVGQQFGQISMFREWRFGPSTTLRQAQSTALPTDRLLPDASNLALILNEMEHIGAAATFNELLTRFLPRFQRFSTRILGDSVQLYLHEAGLGSPVPANHLSDGTLRFVALLALLLAPDPPPLVCLEEPEIGLHPDAVSILAELLIDASSRMQIIVTTHSDTMVSALTGHADSVLVCEYHAGTVVRRIESARLQYWLDRYRLGEIWRLGELGGNP